MAKIAPVFMMLMTFSATIYRDCKLYNWLQRLKKF